MKKIIILTFIMLFSLFCTTYASDTKVTSISINSGKTLYLSIDDFVTLDVTIKPSTINTDTMSFSSTSPKIADVDYKGNITAKKVGSTTITVELYGKKSSITVKVSERNKLLGVDFSINSVSGTNFKEIKVIPHRYDDGQLIEEEVADNYYIYLPSGYFVEGISASYVADRNGVYPFTIYDGNNRRTFYYTVKDIDSTTLINEKNVEDTRENIFFEYNLKYDYEKKQILFNMDLNDVRKVITPDKKTTVSNSVNYYISSLKNNVPLDFSVIIDDVSYDYKVIKQGEFYLLIFIEPVDYDDHSTIVEYFGYNFTTNEDFKAIPKKDIFYDNGNYEVLLESNSNTKEIFNFNISNIDFRSPSVKTSLLDDYTLDLDIEDDFSLDYMITYDGKYVSIGGSKANTTTFTYNNAVKIDYNGEYLFTVVDKVGNRTVACVNIESRKKTPKYPIDYDVHNYKYTKDLFANIGLVYDNGDTAIDNLSIYEITIPGYMKGSSSSYFMPDSPITRAEIITLFCRITDLPYDTSAFLKTKFTDIENHWAKDYISMGSSKKYVAGYKDNEFKPNNNVTRAEFCKMLTNISSFKSKVAALPATSNYNFSDVNGHWAQKEITTVVSRDIIAVKNNYFYPELPITRAEVVHAINKIFGLNPSAGEFKNIYSMYKKYYDFKDINDHEYYSDIIISVIGMYREKIN